MKSPVVAIAVFACVFPIRALADVADAADERRALMVSAQVLTREGQLLRAVSLLEQCQKVTCDSSRDEDCVSLGEFCDSKRNSIREEIPTLRVRVSDDLGAPLPEAQVFLGTERVAQDEPIYVNPGAYLLVAQYLGRESSATIRLDKRGNVEQRLRVDLRSTKASRPVPWYTWTAAGTGFALVAGSFVLGAVSLEQRASLDYCAPFCDPSRRTGLELSTTATYTLMTAGLVGLALSAVTYMLRPARIEPTRLTATSETR